MDDTVLLTGAKGAVGTAIREGLADEYDWRYLFHHPPPFDPDHPYLVGGVEEPEVADEVRVVGVERRRVVEEVPPVVQIGRAHV